MEAINDYSAGVIRVYHTAADVGELEDLISISIYRRCTDAYSSDSEWALAGTKPTITVDDKAFVFVDYSARSGETYEYKAIITTGTDGAEVQHEGAHCKATSSVNGVVIGVADEHYAINLNVTYTTQREYNMSYVQPYYSKYPHSIQNGDANFNTGTVAGYFNPFDKNCSIEAKTGDYAEKLEDFLTDGRIKTLKTYDGYVWRVMIDSPVKREKTNTRDLVYFSFTWHAVAAPIPAGYFI